ncbi:MAG: hypothetical protein IPP86_04530 [Bacteroidetes bacterium]|nr:hypothetical protein [Bacteroidota bacterium]
MHQIKIVVLLILLSHTAITAQTEFRYEHYTISNGLSSNFTKAIEQDTYGLIWIGTIDGLSCFNGYEFTNYLNKDNDTTSLSDNSINDLLIDKDGTLWVATNKGLNKYQRASNNFRRFLSGNNQLNKEALMINRISIGPDSNLWLGTDKGIRVFRTSDNSISIPKITDDSLRKFIESGISGIFADKNGITWIGSSIRGGFRCMDSKTYAPVPYPSCIQKGVLSGYPVNEFYEDRKGVLWFMTGNGLYSYSSKSNLFKRHTREAAPQDTLNYLATSFLEDQQGELWVSIASGPPFYTSIAKVNPETNGFKIYPYVDNDDRGLAWSWASFIFQDKSGIYWIGTSRGIDKMDPLCQQFKLYQQYTNLKYSQFNNIYSIVKDSLIVWLGTDGKSLIKYDLSTNKFEKIVPDGFEIDLGLWAMLQLKDGNLLLGSGLGVHLYEIKKNRCKLLVSPPPPKGSGDSEVSCITQGDNDEVWIGFNGGGVMRYNLKTKKQTLFRNDESNPKSLCSDQVNVIFKDSKGTIWVGTADGVNVFGGISGKGLDRFDAKTSTFTHFNHREGDSASLSNNNVICLAEDKNGILWVGTRNGGLNRFEPTIGKFRSYTKNEGMPSNFITAIQIDDSNRVWASSFTNGIACLDPGTGIIRAFDISHGLQNLRFNRHGSFKTEDGELLFSGVSGFNSFYPSKLKFNTQPPPILITEIKINNEPYIHDSAIYDVRYMNLAYDQSELQFDFAALNFSQTNKNKYAYKLEGYDKSWILSGTSRTAKYTNLDPGNYIFKVKACNNDGVWNEQGVSVSIHIHPPWWRTWWAYVLYFLVLTGSIWYYIKWRERILKARQKVLEQTVSERTADLVAEKKKSDDLLLNILPEEVAEELKAKGSADAKQFQDVTVMFTDFKGFTQISEKLSPSELVSEIDYCFKAFDAIIGKHNIEKIKTIGDSYMCAGGLPVVNLTNAVDVVSAALEIQEFMKQHLLKRNREGKEPFEIRIGIHTGPVVAGIVGLKKFAYDIWGDTVNIASRMESSGEAGKVNISGSTWQLVNHKFQCTQRGKIHAKNKGEIEMYFVEKEN